MDPIKTFTREQLENALRDAQERIEDHELVLDQLVKLRVISLCECGRYFRDTCAACEEGREMARTDAEFAYRYENFPK